jgi:hypothetical protein
MAAWQDNLIPLEAPRLDDHQLAGWRPKESTDDDAARSPARRREAAA